jgi:DNA primase large subunit
MNPPGPQECHGCPYKTFSPDNLQTALITTYGNQGLKSSDLNEIIKQVDGSFYHVACTRVFEITHGVKKGEGVGGGESVDHPNRYYHSLEEANG